MGKKMKLLVIGSGVILLFWAGADVFGLPVLPDSYIKTPSNDVDKSHDAGNWGKNYFDDSNHNGTWDRGEPYADSANPSWTDPKWNVDMSCWMASAANMLGCFGFNNHDSQGIYNELLGQWKWTEGGWQHEAINWYLAQHPGEGDEPKGYKAKWYSYDTNPALTGERPWPTDPFNFAKRESYRCEKVGIVLHSSAIYHAVTFWGWDDSVPWTIITDSDTDTDHYSTTDRNYYKTASSATEWKIDYLTYNVINVPIDYIVSLSPIPEPATVFAVLLLMGLGAGAKIRRR